MGMLDQGGLGLWWFPQLLASLFMERNQCILFMLELLLDIEQIPSRLLFFQTVLVLLLGQSSCVWSRVVQVSGPLFLYFLSLIHNKNWLETICARHAEFWDKKKKKD